MSHPIHLQQRPILSAVFGLALASAVTATSAQAALVEVGGTISINGGTVTSYSDSSSTGSVSEVQDQNSMDFSSNASFRTSVDQNGTFSASTSGRIDDFGISPSNQYSTSAYVEFADSLTNSTTVAQEQLVTISLAAGNAQVHEFDSGGAGDILNTELLLDLSFGSTDVYSSGYRLQNRRGNIFGSQTGSDIFAGAQTSAFGLSNFNWDAQVITVVLGTLNPGTSSNFVYRYSSSSFGSISDAFCDSGEGSLCSSGNSFGDPISFAFSTRAVGGPTTSVPEPATGALLGLGLFALIGSRRRLRNSV